MISVEKMSKTIAHDKMQPLLNHAKGINYPPPLGPNIILVTPPIPYFQYFSDII